MKRRKLPIVLNINFQLFVFSSNFAGHLNCLARLLLLIVYYLQVQISHKCFIFWKTVYSGVDDQQNSNFKWVDANSRCNYFVAASYRHLCSLPLQNYFAEKNIAVSEFELRTSEAPDMDANPHTRMLPHLSINLNKFIPTYLSVKATCQTPIQLAYPKSCTLDLCQRVPQVWAQ